MNLLGISSFVLLLLCFELGSKQAYAQVKRSEAEIRAFREKVKHDRVMSMNLLKIHKQLKAEGRADEAAKIMEQIKARKQRFNDEVAEESGLGEAYSNSKTRKAHPFANSKSREMDRIEWETENNLETLRITRQMCDAMLIRAALLPDSYVWKRKIESFYNLQSLLLDNELEMSKEFETVKEIDAHARRMFNARQRQISKFKLAKERADYVALHKELGGEFGVLTPQSLELLAIPDL